MAENDVLKMKVADLKRELKLRGLPTSGNKIELQERLQTALLDGDLTLEDTSITADLLDDEALTDEEDKGLDLSHEDAMLQSPDKDENKSLEATLAAQQQQQKKVVLKRKAVPALPASTDAPATTAVTATATSLETQSEEKTPTVSPPVEDDSAAAETGDDKKKIKLSDLSTKDRLEMRAKKFGTSAQAADAKTARAARFGMLSGKQDTASSTNGATVPAVSMDVLKKRAERFGVSVSSKMVELERKEKLLKRQERFGAGGVGASTTSSSSSATNGASANPDYAAKAKARLERFKAAVK